LVLSNKKSAYVLERAKKYGIEAATFSKNDLNNSMRIIEILKEKQIDLIVLAGFLLLIPESLIRHFPRKIINIHPALLPKYGGKGMYGMKVHQAVIENSEIESGISIHFVNSKYDEGELIFQAKCKIDSSDNPESLAKKIHQLEYEHFPNTIEQVLNKI
jgi:phosphoribosylglycinamide formyltransferase-1